MNDILLSPPIAFLIYVALVALLNWWGRREAPVGKWTTRVSTYSSGEAAPDVRAVPGYRRFFVTALFFAVLHLGVLVLSSGQLSSASAVYALGLILTLFALILA